MIDWSCIDAVVFDIGGVFLLPHPDPIRAALTGVGVDVRDGEQCFHRAHYRAVRAVADAPVPETDPAFWRAYQVAYLEEVAASGQAIDDALAAWPSLRQLGVMEVWRWVQAANVTALARLAAEGVPLAVVSNNDGSAARQMHTFGVCQVGAGPLTEVAIIVDSGSVGIAKPDPAIFRPALDALGTQPHRTLYVGDMVHADVRGAEAAGMAVVQIDPYDFHDGFAHHRARDVDAIADLLLG